MRKILITAIGVLAGVGLQAQNNGASSLNPSQKMSVEEANRLNGPVQVTYQGGKPYSQWVSEEKAKQQASKTATTLYKTSNTGLIDIPVQAKTASPAQVPDKQVTTPVVAPKQEIVQVVEQPIEPSMPLGGNAGGATVKALQNKKQETVNIQGTSNDVKMLPQPVKPVAETVKTTAVNKETLPAVKSIAPAANSQNSKVSGQNLRTDVPAADQKPVKQN